MNLEAKFVGVSNIGPTSLAVDDARAPHGHDQGSFDWRTRDEWVTTGQIKFDFEVPLPPLPLRAAAPNGLDMYDEAVVGRPEPRQRRNPYDREAQVIQNQMQFDYRLRHEQLRAQRRAGHLTVVDEFFQGGTRAGEVGAEEEGGRRAHQEAMNRLQVNPFVLNQESQTRKITVFYRQQRHASDPRKTRVAVYVQCGNRYPEHVAGGRGGLTHWFAGPLKEESTEFSFEVRRTRTEVEVATER
eukprot:g1808.t1